MAWKGGMMIMTSASWINSGLGKVEWASPGIGTEREREREGGVRTRSVDGVKRRPEIGRVDCRAIRKMCVEATTHQKPSFKRVILFDARGSERVISRHHYRRRATPTPEMRERGEIPPYLLNNQHRTETQAAPRAYCQPTPPLVTSSMYTPCAHYVQPLYVSPWVLVRT